MSRGSEQTGSAPRCATDGGREVVFEEKLSLKDKETARRLITLTRVMGVFMVVVTLVGMVVIAGQFVSMVGGVDVARSILGDILSETPLAIVGVALVGFMVFLIGGFLLQLRRGFEERVHTTVTEAGITVQREGNRRYWQSTEIEIPFDAITAVEYLDPEESSTRIEPGDWRSKQFFAGRGKDWIRIERAADPTVYIGSDRPNELAVTIAQRAPYVEQAEPF